MPNSDTNEVGIPLGLVRSASLAMSDSRSVWQDARAAPISPRIPGQGSGASLAGTYDNVGKTITVTGAGWTFTGGLTTFGLEGIFNGPSGVYGVFSLQTGATGVTVVIGTFTSTTGGDNGMFNFSIKGAAIHGNAVTTSSTIIPLTGTYSPATGAVSIVHPVNPPPPYLALGTYNSTTGAASGTYDNQAGNAGNWAGTKQP